MNLFEDAHGYQDTDWVIGASVLLVLTFRSEQRTEYLLVYIIVFLHLCTLSLQIHKTGKLISHVKYSSKRSDSLRFYLYLCHVIDDFACLEMQH